MRYQCSLPDKLLYTLKVWDLITCATISRRRFIMSRSWRCNNMLNLPRF